MTDTLAPPHPQEEITPATPFVGLVPYGEGDAAFFFGRDDEKAIITANLRASRLTIIYGASGVGKTSVLHAGVVHDLREQVREIAAGRSERAPFAICAFSSWRDDPLSALAETMRAACSEALGGEELPPWQPGEPLLEAVRGWTERVRPLLVALDQFEEYFLYHGAEDGEGTFAVEFPRLVNEPNLRVNFILSLREDAWAKLDRFEDSIPALFDNYVRVDHLDGKAAREAIDGPVREWNVRLPPGEEPYAVEPALAEKVIEAAAAGRLALTEIGNGGGPDAAAAGGVEAPFLQLVLERLWRATVAAGAHTLDLARLEALGGAQQIVENHLLEALGKLTPGEQDAAADLFRYLVTRSKTKIAHPATDLADWTGRPEPEVTAVLEKLCRGESGRILRSVSPPAGETAVSYELFHDVLAEPILEWRKGYEQLREQEAEAQRQRAIRRRLIRIGAVLLALVAGFAGLTAWALKKSSDATRATASGRSVVLASAASDQLARDPDASLLLSLEAVRAGDTAQARGSMISALDAFRRTAGAEAILRAGQGRVSGAAFSPRGGTLAAARYDGKVVLWDAAHDYRRLTALDSGQSSVSALAFSPDGRTLAAAGYDGGEVVLWDAAHDYRKLSALDSGQSGITGIAFSPDGRTLAAAGYDGGVVLWDIAEHRKLAILDSGQSAVWGVAFSPDGRTLAAAGDDGKLERWNAADDYGELAALDSGQSGGVWGVAFSADGTLAAAGAGRKVVLWDAADDYGKPTTLNSGQSAIRGLAFSPDGKTLAAAGDGGEVEFWDAAHDYRKLTALDSGQRVVWGVAFSPDGRTLAAAGDGGEVVVWDTAQLNTLDSGQRDLWGVAFRPHGSTLAAAGYGGVVLWHGADNYGKPTTLDSDQSGLSGVAFSPDGGMLAGGGDDGGVVLWRGADDYGKPTTLDSGQSSVWGVAFSRDGSMLAAAGDDGGVVLWRAADNYGKPTTLDSGRSSVYGVAFGRDGTLAAAGAGRKVVLWRAADNYGKPTALDSGQSEVWGVAFSPDGETLAAAGQEGDVVLWDAAHNYRRLTVLHTGPNEDGGVAFSPNGEMLAATGAQSDVVLWDAAHDYRKLTALDSGQKPVRGVAFSPDSTTLAAVGGGDGKVVRWDVLGDVLGDGLSDLKAKVCGLVHGNLTKAEWKSVAPGVPYSTTCPD
jgi:WD40 repeat protein